MLNTQKLAREQELADVREVLGLPAGTRLYKRLLALANTLGASFANDPYSTAFNEGLRQMGIMLIKDASEAAPELIASLLNPTDNKMEEINERN